METAHSVIDQDTLYWILGTVAALLLTIAFFAIYRIGRGQRTVEVTPEPLPEATLDPLAERLSAERTPQNEAAPSVEFRDAGVPADDLPPDMAARNGTALPEDASALPHRIEEIEKPAPKPLFSALSNTRSSLFGRIKSLFSSKPTLSSGELEDLEEVLYTSDLGPQTVQRLMGAVENRLEGNGAQGFEAVREALKAEMLDIFEKVAGEVRPVELGAAANSAKQGAKPLPLHLVTAKDTAPVVHHGSEEYLEGLERLNVWDHRPAVLMIVGVNGAGKTTTIGKLARRFAQSGRRVLVAAGDTFRAAASDQLKIWTDRAQVEIFAPENVTDPSAVSFMACEKAQGQGFDVVIIDTAGRLHTQKNLMEELKKMKRVIQKKLPEAPHEVLLVLDANSGQNALVQAREFHQALGVTGVVLTKLDGTAKGGVAVGLACELELPIKLIGVGEGIDDLRRFSSREFIDSII
jgi:fused signal recognition particle receptor